MNSDLNLFGYSGYYYPNSQNPFDDNFDFPDLSEFVEPQDTSSSEFFTSSPEEDQTSFFPSNFHFSLTPPITQLPITQPTMQSLDPSKFVRIEHPPLALRSLSPIQNPVIPPPYYPPIKNSFNLIPKTEVETKEVTSTEVAQTKKRKKAPKAEIIQVFKKVKVDKQIDPALKKDIRREKNRLSAQKTRERKQLQLDTLLDQQQETIQLGQKVENYAQRYSGVFPLTTLPLQDDNLVNRQLSDDEKVPLFLKRIEQITETMTRETIELKMKNDALEKRNAFLEQQFQLLQRQVFPTNFS